MSDDSSADSGSYAGFITDDEILPDNSGITNRLKLYPNSKTAIFWNDDSYPLTNFPDPMLVKKDITDVVFGGGYHGEIEIRIYSGQRFKVPVAQEYETAGISMNPIPDDDDEFMLADIFNCAARNSEGSNILVLSKTLGDVTATSLSALYVRHFGVVLSNPDAEQMPVPILAPLDWLWKKITEVGSED